MKPNMGTIDRAARILFALVVAVLYLAGSITSTAALILGIFAAISVITSLAAFCPLYVPLKISTIKKEAEAHKTT